MAQRNPVAEIPQCSSYSSALLTNICKTSVMAQAFQSLPLTCEICIELLETLIVLMQYLMTIVFQKEIGRWDIYLPIYLSIIFRT